MIKIVIFFVAFVALASAMPFIIEDEEGQQYYVTPVLDRQRRAAQWFGGGGATSHQQGGFIGKQNPNGSGFSASYGHANGFGHTVGADAMVPVWSNKGRHGETTVNVGGGASQHFGGLPGNMNLDKRVGVNVNHRW